MIAPLRETNEQLDDNAKLLARARRAVAAALLRDKRVVVGRNGVSTWSAWLFAIWTLAVAVSSMVLVSGGWKLLPY